MASDDAVNYPHSVEKSEEYESTDRSDRSLLDFIKKDDKDESKVLTTEFDDKLHVSESEPKFEDCKVSEREIEKEEIGKPSLLQKVHSSGSSSSSSSEEEVEEGGERIKKKKEKKGLKEKIAEKIHKDDVKEEDTSVPVSEPEDKKGLLDKIKEKLPGHGTKKVEEETQVAPTPAAPVEYATVEDDEPAKKGLIEKIKEKLPGYHPKTSAEEEIKKDEKDSA